MVGRGRLAFRDRIGCLLPHDPPALVAVEALGRRVQGAGVVGVLLGDGRPRNRAVFLGLGTAAVGAEAVVFKGVVLTGEVLATAAV